MWLFLLTLCTASFAQYSDSFTDGDYTNNPTWDGSTDKFQINGSFELWLNAPVVNDQAYLYTFSQAIHDASWECLVRLNFNPSSTNYARYYLVSDQSNLLSPLNGYFIQVGSTEDDICLYRQTGSTVTKIIDGPDGVLNSAAVQSRIRATRNAAGDWTLEADTLGGNSFIHYGNVNDVNHLQSLFSGVCCTYTSTRSDKFFFDDFIVNGNPHNDGTGPFISGLTLISPTQIQLHFNEPPLPASASITTNYLISGGIGNPSTANINMTDNKKIDITLGTPLSYATAYTISVQQVSDYQSNIMTDTVLHFADYQAVLGDVVINEIMADPTPPANLPEYEYVELYNTTNLPIRLDGWKFTVNTTTKTLPTYTLLPGEFVILLHENGLSEFSMYPAIGISSFPSINNSGATIRIQDGSNMLINEVSFTIAWYNNPNVSTGGFSIEKMNPTERCGGINNWAATLNINGGTPGSINSIHSNNPLPFTFKQIEVISADSMLVEFTKSIDTSSIHPSNFFISGSVGSPSQVIPTSSNSVLLITSTPLSINIPYIITCYAGISDCAGNSLSMDISETLMYYVASLFDIVINEIMVDESPAVGLPLTEYIELHNRKDFPVQLKNYQLIVNNSSYTIPSCILQPDSFIVLVKSGWESEFDGISIVGMSSFPSFTNTGATVTLRHKNGTLLHNVSYTDMWYRQSSKSNGGWSLEQIDPSLPCLEKTNWNASVHIKGGTPGFRNSVYQSLADTTAPYAFAIGISAPDSIFIYLRESIVQAPTPSSVFISGGIGNPSQIILEEPTLNKLILKLPSMLSADSIYSIYISGYTSDCSGNVWKHDTFTVAIPVAVQSHDIVINEILSDPPANEIDYIEIYNKTNQFFDLKDLYLGTGDTTTGFITNPKPISTTSIIMEPGSYRLLSTDMDIVLQNYKTDNLLSFINLTSIPSYNNSSGTVTLSNISQQIIDWVNYEEDWHFALLNSTDGVSLERVNPVGPSLDKTNWHSASQTTGFGTPGYKNSQFVSLSPIAQKFSITPEVFSPDQDGWDDLLFIQYNLNNPGYIATVKIYDATGKYVQTLANNQLIGTEGYFTWDGTNFQGNKARTGIHVILFEIITPDGKIESFKAPCVIATRL